MFHLEKPCAGFRGGEEESWETGDLWGQRSYKMILVSLTEVHQLTYLHVII